MFNKISILLGVLIKLPFYIFYWVSYYIPRNNKKWICSAWEGKAYRGNCRYFFEYISKNDDIDSIWVTKNRELYNSLKGSINIRHAYSMQGIYDLLTARVIIISHGLYDVIPCFTRGALLINLGHASYPIKKMSFTKIFSEMSFLHRTKAFLISPYDHIKPTYEIVTSNNTKNSTIFLSAEQSNEGNRIIPLGSPKSDYLIGIKSKCKAKLFENIFYNAFPEINSRDKMILFLPTWRGDKEFNILNYGYNSAQINSMLSENDAFMFINYHPFDEDLRSDKVDKLGKRVFAISYGGDEITQLLCVADIFITDYSSLYSDFLLYDKPIIFSKFSHDEYVKERELQVDYDLLPGEIVTNWSEMCLAISVQLSERGRSHKIDRELWRKFIYSGTDDGESCNRIATFIENSV